MGTVVVVWNETESEGIILTGVDAEEEARHACAMITLNPVSTLADSFREIYGESEPCTYEIRGS